MNHKLPAILVGWTSTHKEFVRRRQSARVYVRLRWHGLFSAVGVGRGDDIVAVEFAPPPCVYTSNWLIGDIYRGVGIFDGQGSGAELYVCKDDCLVMTNEGDWCGEWDGLDGVPSQIHTIEDPVAYRAAYRNFCDALDG